jgi:hypothetical protein
MDKSTRDKAGEGAPSSGKKPYTAPTFRSESVFVNSALACGKVQTTQSGCSVSRKAS